MRALLIESAGRAVIREVLTPSPEAGQVVIAVEYVGICGSDLHYYAHGANGDFVIREPLIPGHELSGRILHDPSGQWSQGQPVTVHPARFGDRQDGYQTHPHLWPGGSYLGSASTWPHTQGAAVEQLVVDASMVRSLPEGLSIRRAALAEPLAVGMHAVAQAQVQGARVLISGAGPIGLLTAVAARAAGAAKIHISDVLAGPLERGRQVGADAVWNVTQTPLPESSYDVVLECSGVGAAVAAALNAVRPAGTVVQVGMMPAGPQPVNVASLISREIRWVGTFRFHDEIGAAVELLAREASVDAVITHEFGLEHADEAFSVAAESEVSGKVLLAL